MRAPSLVPSSLLLVVALAGCGQPSARPAAPVVAQAGGGDGGPGDGGGVAAEIAPPPPPAPLTAEECAALVDRMLSIGLAEQQRKTPQGPVPSAEQQQAIRAQMIAELAPSCATIPRSAWDCAMAASDRAAMAACEPAP